MQKEIFFLGNFHFLSFFDFLRPAFSHGRLGHPQSLEYLLMYLLSGLLILKVVKDLLKRPSGAVTGLVSWAVFNRLYLFV